MQLLDGTLKLRYCTTSFTQRFHPWSLKRHGGWVGKREDGSSAHLLDGGGITKSSGSGLPERHVLAFMFMIVRTEGFQRQSDGKCCIALTPQELGETWACLAIYFLAFGVC